MELLPTQKVLPPGESPILIEQFSSLSWQSEAIATYMQLPEAHICLMALGNRGQTVITRGADNKLWLEAPLEHLEDGHISDSDYQKLLQDYAFMPVGNDGRRFTSPDALSDLRLNVAEVSHGTENRIDSTQLDVSTIWRIIDGAQKLQQKGDYDASYSAFQRLARISWLQDEEYTSTLSYIKTYRNISRALYISQRMTDS